MKILRLIGRLHIVVGFFIGFALNAQTAGEGMAEAIRSQLKDPSKPFTFIVKVKVKEGKSAAFETAFAEALKLTRKEKGCLRYDLNREKDSAVDYVVYERWADFDAVKSHLGTSYIATLLSRVGELGDGAPKMELLLPVAE
jgi:quinol monooxygenase YgiN